MVGLPARAPVLSPAQNVGYIIVDDLPQDLVGDLGDAGVSKDDLRELAGRDGVIRGDEELDNLFSRIDEPQRVLTTSSGRSLFDALRDQIDQNLRRAHAEGGRRFSEDPFLTQVLDGAPSLGPGAPAPSVYRVEQALADIGLLDPGAVDGLFGDTTVQALEAFQLEAELPLSSRIDGRTLGALSAVAPPPGQRIVRTPEYGRMTDGDRLSITLAVGADDRIFTRNHAELELVGGLLERGFDRLLPGHEGHEPHVDQWAKNGTHLYVVMPSSNQPSMQAAAARVAAQSAAVLWSGSQFTLGENVGRPSAGLRASNRQRPGLGGPEYQLLCISGCDERSLSAQNRLLERADVDTDILTTTAGASERLRSRHTLHFLDVVLDRGTTDAMRAPMDGLPMLERGFLHNRSNTTESV